MRSHASTGTATRQPGRMCSGERCISRPSRPQAGTLGTRGRDSGYRAKRGSTERQLAEVEPDSLAVVTIRTCAQRAQRPTPSAVACREPQRIVHHDDMFNSEALTRGVRVIVRVRVRRRAIGSRQKNQWFFLYTVTISNEGAETGAAAHTALGHHRRHRATSKKCAAPASSASSRHSNPANRSSTRQGAL